MPGGVSKVGILTAIADTKMPNPYLPSSFGLGRHAKGGLGVGARSTQLFRPGESAVAGQDDIASVMIEVIITLDSLGTYLPGDSCPAIRCSDRELISCGVLMMMVMMIMLMMVMMTMMTI